MSEALERMERLRRAEEARILHEKNKAKRDFVQRFVCSPMAAHLVTQDFFRFTRPPGITIEEKLVEAALKQYDAIEKELGAKQGEK